MKEHILIVDDESDLREILQFNLENEGYTVDAAESAEEALDMLAPEHSLILLDVMMEGMSGYKMAEKLRKSGNLIPVIFLTAKDTENDMLTGFSVGGDDYISKPFSVKEIVARVKAVLKRSKVKDHMSSDVSLEGELVFKNIVMNLDSMTVFADHNSVVLTKTEFEILKILMSKPGRISSREDILSKVWSDDVFVLERTVDVHITRLRKKLGDCGSYIVNRSGYGYCLE